MAKRAGGLARTSMGRGPAEHPTTRQGAEPLELSPHDVRCCPKADKRGCCRIFRFVPKADIAVVRKNAGTSHL